MRDITNPDKGELENMLEIVKHVIAVKIDERKRADAAADRLKPAN